MGKERLDAAVADLNRTFNLPAYEGIDVAWVAVIKLANLFPGKSEHARLLALLDHVPEEALKAILASQAVDELLNLDPPLESVLAMPHERLNADRTANELREVRRLRDTDPKAAMRPLAEILKRIRNRRAHGFKTPHGERDQEILRPSVRILREVGAAAAEGLGAR